jgi:hypothetical protein
MSENVPDGGRPASQNAEISISLTSYLAEWDRYTSHINSLSNISHSYHCPELIGDHQFISAWEIYCDSLGRRLITVLTQQREDACDRECDHVSCCDVLCAVVCAPQKGRGVLETPSSIVTDSDSQ